MIILSILNIKHFMSKLFVKEAFDSWLVSDITITTHNTFCINGQLNLSFFDDEEQKQLQSHEYSTWKLLRPVCFGIIRGNKSPSFMKLVFQLPEDETNRLIKESSSAYAPEDINGLFINIRYEHGRLLITTGSSIRIFAADRSLDESFEQYVRSFLTEHEIEYDMDF